MVKCGRANTHKATQITGTRFCIIRLTAKPTYKGIRRRQHKRRSTSKRTQIPFLELSAAEFSDIISDIARINSTAPDWVLQRLSEEGALTQKTAKKIIEKLWKISCQSTK